MTTGPDGVEVLVDRDACLSSQTCVRMQPLAFAIDDEGVSMVLPTVVEVTVEDLVAVAHDCPVSAIDVRRDGVSLVHAD